jgi:myosin heavy subunit
MQGLQMMGFQANDVESITAILAAILHIGDTEFEEAANVRGDIWGFMPSAWCTFISRQKH